MIGTRETYFIGEEETAIHASFDASDTSTIGDPDIDDDQIKSMLSMCPDPEEAHEQIDLVDLHFKQGSFISKSKEILDVDQEIIEVPIYDDCDEINDNVAEEVSEIIKSDDEGRLMQDTDVKEQLDRTFVNEDDEVCDDNYTDEEIKDDRTSPENKVQEYFEVYNAGEEKIEQAESQEELDNEEDNHRVQEQGDEENEEDADFSKSEDSKENDGDIDDDICSDDYDDDKHDQIHISEIEDDEDQYEENEDYDESQEVAVFDENVTDTVHKQDNYSENVQTEDNDTNEDDERHEFLNEVEYVHELPVQESESLEIHENGLVTEETYLENGDETENIIRNGHKSNYLNDDSDSEGTVILCKY